MSQPQRKHKARLGAVSAKMISLTAPVQIHLEADAEGKPGPATFQSVAYSGASVSGGTATPKLDAPYVINLAGLTVAKSAKVNLDHKREQRVGHVTEAMNDGRQVELKGVLSAATEYRDQVRQSAADGYTWEFSIEADLSKQRKLKKGEKAMVNGREIIGPHYIFDKSTLTAVAFVEQGADEGNSVSIAASAAGVTTMNPFEQWIVTLGMDPATISTEAKAELQAAFKAKGETKPQGSLSILAAKEKAAAEREERITNIALAAMRENRPMRAEIEEFAQNAIQSEMDPRDFELELLRNTRLKASAFRTQQGAHGSNDPRVLECALAMASNLPNVEKHYKEEVLDAVDRAGLRSVSLQQIILRQAQANGYHVTVGERLTSGNLRSVLRYALPEGEGQARLGGFSTVSLPNILGAVANKQILAGYMEEDATWRELSAVRSVSNFYTQNYYRMLDSLEYEKLGSGGEIKHGTLGEETYTSQANTYAKMLGITRQQLINDDLGAFDDIRTRLGRGAAKKFNNVFWTAFMDNSSFFTSGNTNYISGSTTNLGTDGVGLALGVKAARTMTSPSADGTKRIGNGFVPTILLVPPELEGNAEILYRNQNLGAVASSSANIYANKYRPVVQNRLSDSAFTGYSTTAWYLIGNDMKPMLVTFLNGNQTPVVESAEADFSTLGIQFRGYHDFGCDKSEYLSAIKSKGAA